MLAALTTFRSSKNPSSATDIVIDQSKRDIESSFL
jgi:hypothetical protein